jgi:hypothetical protein
MASTGVEFTKDTDKYIKDYMKEIGEYKARNVDLEEENRCYKHERGNVTEHKACSYVVHKELCDMKKQVYPCLQ